MKYELKFKVLNNDFLDTMGGQKNNQPITHVWKKLGSNVQLDNDNNIQTY